MNARKRYDSNLTDKQWQLLTPLSLPPAREGHSIEVPRREIVNAIIYKLKNGCL